ncbi:hypothetical protein GW17_00052543 [Ensete ventricosum]|nr:hypothetical protein GW17_00052543 [Ensete ventricosum]RZS17856.1 hypothetical protein BHM03_00050055 [Ensete ventricosum]
MLTVNRIHLLGFAKWVQEDGTVVAVCENFAEDLFREVFDPGSGYEKVQPWMRNFPQAFGPQLHLGDVHPVQELQVGDLRLEEGGRGCGTGDDHLVHDIGLVSVEVFGHLEAEEDPPVGVEPAGLNGILRVERRSPVVEQSRPVDDHESFDVVEGLPRRDQHLLVLREAGEVGVQNSDPLHL